MKRHIQLVFIFLLAIITTFVLAGCNESTDTTGTGTQTTGTGTDTSGNGTTATTAIDEEGDVVLAFLHAGNIQTSTSKVEAAISAYVRSKLGFGVTFKLVNVFDQNQIYTNWLVANEEIDILNVFGNPDLYINEKRVREIGSLITEQITPYFAQELDNHAYSKVMGVDGKMYGISVWGEFGYLGYSYTIRKDVLELAGLYGEGEGQYMHLDQITYSDLDRIFAAVKAAMPKTGQGLDVYPCSAMATQDYSSGLIPFDPMGTNLYRLAGMMMDPVTGEFTEEIVNYYETDEFKEYVEWIGKVYENGYINPDADITQDWFADFYKREQFVGVLLATDAKIRYQWETENDWDMVQLQLCVPHSIVTSSGQALMIPSKSERPMRAMQFIDLLYSDVELLNMLYYGIEGEEWMFVDEENELITEASEGARQNYIIGGFWGDHGKVYDYVSADDDVETIIAEKLQIEAEKSALYAIGVTHESPTTGFVYDSSAQNTRINNIVANVLSKYYTTLIVGAGSKGTDNTYTGPNSTYAKFIEALNKAKLYLVVEDKQTQYNAWKAGQGE